jgi:serine/threonine-protein kinase HipA
VSAPRRAIEVWADWIGLGGPSQLGTLHATTTRGKESFAFEYDRGWLDSPHSLVLDPSLQLYRGKQHAPVGRENFGVFLDSCPDRWGRVLMRRREAQLARRERRAERTLRESDYLLGVFDRHRMGALRFRLDADGPFLDDCEGMASPPWTSLRELEQACLALEREDAERDPDYDKWLRLLMAPGASLGGARPKADVSDPSGQLWIAKFPSRADELDIGAWEHVTHQLASAAGVVTSPSRAQRFASRHHTFLTLRFDRDGEQRRHFASAMTLLDRRDGEAGGSYLDLADVIVREGAAAAKDLEQLWRRIVFSICVSNVDDHLRNHGFLLSTTGWRLAPAYDLNPNEGGDGLSLAISEHDNAQDLDLALSVASSFRVSAKRAKGIVAEVVAAVRKWRAVAGRAGIARSEQQRIARAFRVAEQWT